MEHQAFPTTASSSGGGDNNSACTGANGGGGRKRKVSMNKCCDRCNADKKKCDGDGLSRCSRCVSKGLKQRCVYIKRRPHRSRQPKYPERAVAAAPERGALVLGPGKSTAFPLSRGDNEPILQAGQGQSLKRCRLRASPATGLVGMQENAFLSDYFGCMGFIPVTCRSIVREAMVRIMCARGSSAGSARFRTNRGVKVERGAQGNALEAAVRSSAGGAATERAVDGGNTGAVGSPGYPVDASMCIFWCAVALGGLVRGQPVELVGRYVRLAKGALDSSLASAQGGCSGRGTTTYVVRALAAMAYLHGFCGDHDAFYGYAERANDALRVLTNEGQNDGLPEELIEAVLLTEDFKCFYSSIKGDGPGPGPDAWWHQPDSALPDVSIGDAVTEEDMFRFVTKSLRIDAKKFVANFVSGVDVDDRESSPAAGRSAGEGMEGLDGDDDLRDEGRKGVYLSGGTDTCADISGQLPPHVVAVLTAGIDGCAVKKFEIFETVVDRPEIREGIGGLMINYNLVFNNAASMNIDGAMERLSRCLEVLGRYPGLMRFHSGLHKAHILAAMLVQMKQEELYEELRVMYNPVRPSDNLPMPPLEEWRGVDDICPEIYCRQVGGLFEKHSRAADEAREAEACLLPTSDELSYEDVSSATILLRQDDDMDFEAVCDLFPAED